MNEFSSEESAHRDLDRYQCPPFFIARISSGDRVEERATVENLSVRGLSVRTSCPFEQGAQAEIELRSSYVAPIKIHARVRWVRPPECEGSLHQVGFSIHKVGMFEWFRFMRLISQLRRELW